jgi:hypothetical protein
MTMCFRPFVAVMLVGLATCVSAGESPPDSDARSGHADRAADPQSAKKKSEDKGRDLDSCRRDARGLDGPERARFMTECLKTRE